MGQFDLYIISLIEKIGFNLYSSNHSGLLEYKYHPSYFEDKHYTMIFFTSNISYSTSSTCVPLGESTDHRLYIHNNIDGSFVSSPYQTSSYTDFDKRYIKQKIDKIFSSELRDLKINELIYE